MTSEKLHQQAICFDNHHLFLNQIYINITISGKLVRTRKYLIDTHIVIHLPHFKRRNKESGMINMICWWCDGKINMKRKWNFECVSKNWKRTNIITLYKSTLNIIVNTMREKINKKHKIVHLHDVQKYVYCQNIISLSRV